MGKQYSSFHILFYLRNKAVSSKRERVGWGSLSIWGREEEVLNSYFGGRKTELTEYLVLLKSFEKLLEIFVHKFKIKSKLKMKPVHIPVLSSGHIQLEDRC